MCESISTNLHYNCFYALGIVGIICVIAGPIFTGFLYSEIKGLSFCCMSGIVLGGYFIYLAKKNLPVKKKLLSDSPSQFEVGKPIITEKILRLIKKHRSSIFQGQSNNVIEIISSSEVITSSSRRVFKIANCPYYFKTASPITSGKPLAKYSKDHAKVRFAGKQNAKQLIRNHSLENSIAIPEAKVFTIDNEEGSGFDFIAVEPFSFNNDNAFQLNLYGQMEPKKLLPLAEFIILARYNDIKTLNVPILENGKFGVIDFDDQNDPNKSPIERIFEGFFGNDHSQIQGLFGIACKMCNTDERFTDILKMIIAVARKHNILDALETEINKRIIVYKSWLQGMIFKIKNSEDSTIAA